MLSGERLLCLAVRGELCRKLSSFAKSDTNNNPYGRLPAPSQSLSRWFWLWCGTRRAGFGDHPGSSWKLLRVLEVRTSGARQMASLSTASVESRGAKAHEAYFSPKYPYSRTRQRRITPSRTCHGHVPFVKSRAAARTVYARGIASGIHSIVNSAHVPVALGRMAQGFGASSPNPTLHTRLAQPSSKKELGAGTYKLVRGTRAT